MEKKITHKARCDFQCLTCNAREGRGKKKPSSIKKKITFRKELRLETSQAFLPINDIACQLPNDRFL